MNYLVYAQAVVVSSSSNVGLIVGLIAAIVVTLSVLSVGAVFFYKRYKNNRGVELQDIQYRQVSQDDVDLPEADNVIGNLQIGDGDVDVNGDGDIATQS